MNLVEAARKGAEMVDGLAQTGSFIIEDDSQVLACAIGAAHIGIAGEYSEYSAAYWAESLEIMYPELNKSFDDVFTYNDSQAESLDEAIDYLEREHPHLAQVVVS